MSRDPRPWLEEGAPSPELEALLESARDDEPTPQQLASVAAKLGPLLAAPAAHAAGGAAAGKVAAAVKGGLGLKVAIAVGTVAAIGGAFQVGRVYPLRQGVTAVTAPAPAPAPLPEPPAPPEPVEVPEAPPPPPPPPPAPVAKPAPETDLLQAAMAALQDGQYAKALAACERHARGYGAKGLLVQEREVIAIEALVRLGRAAEAKARADRFIRAFPTSTHLMKVEALVAGE